MLPSVQAYMKKTDRKPLKKKKHKKLPWWKSPKLLGALATIFLLLFAAGILLLPGAADRVQERTVQPLIEACPQDDQDCQKKYYSDKYNQEGLEAAFQSLRAEYAIHSSVQANCHQLTHVIGRAAAQKYKNVADAYEKGDEFCWSGYYHGVMEGLIQKMGNDDVRNKLNTICQSLKDTDPYSFKHYNCAHGIGHGIMLIEADELFASLKICDNLTDNWERESCYGGVYMENVMAHMNPDHKTKYLKDDDPLYPCTAVEDKYAQQCYLMQTSHSLMVLGNDFAKVFDLCSSLAAQHQMTCYTSVGRDASGNSISDPERTHATCMLGKSEQAREGCMRGAVRDFVSYHHSDQQAGVFCDRFEESLRAMCHQEKTQYYSIL
jgi:hypothetical protein